MNYSLRGTKLKREPVLFWVSMNQTPPWFLYHIDHFENMKRTHCTSNFAKGSRVKVPGFTSHLVISHSVYSCRKVTCNTYTPPVLRKVTRPAPVLTSYSMLSTSPPPRLGFEKLSSKRSLIRSSSRPASTFENSMVLLDTLICTCREEADIRHKLGVFFHTECCELKDENMWSHHTSNFAEGSRVKAPGLTSLLVLSQVTVHFGSLRICSAT